MFLERSRLYLIIFIACAAGYIWLFFNLYSNKTDHQSVEVCIVKKVANIPCPSCGSTRSLISILNGEFGKAILYNPLGYIIAFIMIVMPIWIVIDWLNKSNSFYRVYKGFEIFVKKPQNAIPLIILVILNWVWNIIKGI